MVSSYDLQLCVLSSYIYIEIQRTVYIVRLIFCMRVSFIVAENGRVSAVMRCYSAIATTQYKYHHTWHRVSLKLSPLLTFSSRLLCLWSWHTPFWPRIWRILRCDEAYGAFSIDVTRSNCQFCAFLKPHTYIHSSTYTGINYLHY